MKTTRTLTLVAATHALPTDTRYLGVGVRIQVINPKDAAEVALVNKLQDRFIIKSNSADPLPAFRWDLESLKALTARYEKESARYSSFKGMQGPRGNVNEKTRHIAAAAGWGLFPEWDATCLNYSGGQDLLLQTGPASCRRPCRTSRET
jgi:hypothetical protein